MVVGCTAGVQTSVKILGTTSKISRSLALVEAYHAQNVAFYGADISFSYFFLTFLPPYIFERRFFYHFRDKFVSLFIG